MQVWKGVGCMASTTITIRMDEELKKQAETLFDEIGMDMNTAVTAFIKTAVRQQKIPFELSADPFYSETNQARLRDAIRGPESGEGVVRKTMTELEAMENE